jgi:hypothetical protein
MKTFKKIIFVAVLLSFTFRVFAPSREMLTIIVPRPVEPYRKLINAIGKVENNYDTLAYNPVEKAVGFFQIRPIRLKDYNRRTGNHYKMKDLYNYKVSEKIFLFYASEIGPYNFEKIAKRWNGSGPKTYYYWKRVKKSI